MKYLSRVLTAVVSVSVVSISSAAMAAENYCIALRGNGELMPAHLGALSKTIETFGVPQMMAGGSSASLSTFLTESILMNPEISALPQSQEKADKAALMLKSVQGVIENYFSEPQWKSLYDFFNVVSNSQRQMDALKVLMSLQLNDPQSQKKIMKALQALKDSEIFYGPAVRKALSRIQDPSVTPQEVALRLRQIQTSVAVIGKFDAKNDHQLMIRDGVVNFDGIAKAFGALGDLLSLRGVENSSIVRAAFNDMMTDCLSISKGKNWADIISQKPSCLEKHKKFTQVYLTESAKLLHTSRLDDLVGQNMRSLISTSVIIGESAVMMKQLKDDLDKRLTTDIGRDMKLNDAEVKFGYWGREADLDKIQMNFSQNKELGSADKSQRLMSLKQTSWRNALSLSPAEPGLSSFKEFKIVGSSETVLSAGGWSDLHPVLVLKGAGCEKVVYVTRRGADSIFAMGLAKRLFGFDEIPWEKLDPYGKDIAKKFVNNGDPQDQTSQWSRMYNLANPHSSMSVSLRQADAIQCTDWNRFDIKKDFRAMIADAYGAPFYLGSSLENAADSLGAVLKKSDLKVDSQLGYPVYSGCIPF